MLAIGSSFLESNFSLVIPKNSPRGAYGTLTSGGEGFARAWPAANIRSTSKEECNFIFSKHYVVGGTNISISIRKLQEEDNPY